MDFDCPEPWPTWNSWSWLRRSLLYPPMRWTKIRGEKLGRPIVGRNDVVHLFRPKLWANASKQNGVVQNLNFTIDKIWKDYHKPQCTRKMADSDSSKFISVNLQKHGLKTSTSEDGSNERYECWQESYFVMITLLVTDYTDLNNSV